LVEGLPQFLNHIDMLVSAPNSAVYGVAIDNLYDVFPLPARPVLRRQTSHSVREAFALLVRHSAQVRIFGGDLGSVAVLLRDVGRCPFKIERSCQFWR